MSCDSFKINNLIEKLYSQTKTAYHEAQKGKFNVDKTLYPNDNITGQEHCTAIENIISPSYNSFKSNTTEFKKDTMASLSSDEVNSNNSDSKVVVQVLPLVEFGNISPFSEHNNAVHGLSKKSAGFERDSFNCSLDVFKQLLKPKIQSFEHLTRLESDTDEDLSSNDEYDEKVDNYVNTNSIVNKDKIMNPTTDELPVKNLVNNGSVQSSQTEMQVSSAKEDGNVKDTDENEKTHKSVNGDFIIHPGGGMKLCAIESLSSRLETASASVIRILHFILYGTYGLTSSETVLSSTRQNILLFSGFQFDDSSSVYYKKRNILEHLPYPLLTQISTILVNAPPKSRSDCVEELLSFLKKPEGKLHPKDDSCNLLKEEVVNETENFKKLALQEFPVVVLERLSDQCIEEMTHKGKIEESTNSPSKSSFEKCTTRSSAINKDSVVQLKNFPEIVLKIQNARRRIINLLHSLLYGRPGSGDCNRQNILEFGGFNNKQKIFVTRRSAFLSRLKARELMQMCEVFNLRVKSGTKMKKIKKLLNFLCNPGADLNKRKPKGTLLPKERQTTPKDSNGQPNRETHQKEETFSHETEDSITDSSQSADVQQPKIKLKDFETVCSNIECATPEDLVELNDLLYVKPCDSSVIHQKILDFSSFTFNSNSYEFHYRKTLMQYMTFKVIRKIAKFLDIDGWENSNNHEDLVSSILKFLMDMKLPDKKKKSADLKNKKLKARPHILKLHSFNNVRGFCKSRSHTPENVDSTYASEEINNNEYYGSTPRSSCSHEKMPYSRYRHRRNGISIKQESILNDSTPLLDFIQHPTDKELHLQVDKIINNTSLSISMGDLVREVLNCYPHFNLHYRIDFIKAKALEILQELRQRATLFID